MNKKLILFPFCAMLLTGCKIKNLYIRNAYNSPVFDENYYTIFDDSGLDDTPSQGEPHIVTPIKISNLSGDNLSKKYPEYKNGILSKLYDGRTNCGGLYQLSRVQLNKTGFGTKLPKNITKASSFEFSARGGTTCQTPLMTTLHFNLRIDVIAKKVIYTYFLNNLALPTDNNSMTYLYHFDFGFDIESIDYYSLSFDCIDTPSNVTDDYTNKEKDHLAIMLYEVLID